MTLPSVDSTQQQKQQRQKPLAVVNSKNVAKTDIKAGQPVYRESDPGDEPTGYVRRRVDVKMPHKYAMILHNKLRQLQDVGARLSDGTEVSDHTKAVLWILENEIS